MKPLEGYTVVDLTTFVAAPVCGRLLSDMGARVIKVEPPKGDAWRSTGISFAPSRFNAVENPVFDLYNSGKDMICLNLKTEAGMAVMHKLLEKADVFVTNNRPAALHRLGLSYEDLKEKYPKLVYGIVLGYGEKGPDADKPAYDTTAFWSRSGFLRDTAVASEDYYPVEAPSSVGDSYTGTNLTMQILAALLNRQTTGQGQYVKASLYHVGAFAMATMTVKSQRPFGAKLPMARWEGKPVTGAFRCADGEWIYLSATPAQFFGAAGRPDILQDPMWLPENLMASRKQRYEAMRDVMITKTVDQWMELLAPLDTPTVRMAHFADVSEDEQAWANGYLERVEYATGNTNVLPTCPIEMDCVGTVVTQPTRCLGQDTAAVLAELGYTREQIDGLVRDGAVITGK